MPSPVFAETGTNWTRYSTSSTLDAAEVAWYRAKACYTFAVISGLNLGLHRRGFAAQVLRGQGVAFQQPQHAIRRGFEQAHPAVKEISGDAEMVSSHCW